MKNENTYVNEKCNGESTHKRLSHYFVVRTSQQEHKAKGAYVFFHFENFCNLCINPPHAST